MTKTERLTFRIPKYLSDKIDVLVEDYDEIRDRSEFGTKAVHYLIKGIQNTKSEKEVIGEAILALANHIDFFSPELTKIRVITKTKIFPQVLLHVPGIESNPDLQRCMGLFSRMDEGDDLRNKLLSDLSVAVFPEDFADLFERYSHAFFTGDRSKI